MDALIKNQAESAQLAKKVANFTAPSEPSVPEDISKRRLPVGASVLSAHIDYEYFDVGTGQVRSVQIEALHFIASCLNCLLNYTIHVFDAMVIGLS